MRRNAICSIENEGKSDSVAIGVDFYTLSAGMAELLSRSGRRWPRGVVLCTTESAVLSWVGFFLREILRSFVTATVQWRLKYG